MIIQDSRGFTWFGTNGGVGSYDGTTFAVHDPMQVHAQSAIHEEGTDICYVVLHLYNVNVEGPSDAELSSSVRCSKTKARVRSEG